MKLFAINLPQFHQIPENDRWWGTGFTEWDNVRSGKPLFRWHRQPVVPLDNNYYDMSEAKTLIWQHQLARSYGIDGFVYYHYWFNGRLLLERPVEMLLSTMEAEQEFCLCWANESWTRAWDGKQRQVLMEQTFGGEEDWRRHIAYLSQFFRDGRYLQIEGRYVLFVYSPKKIPMFDAMISFWNEFLRQQGLAELYIIEYISSFNPRASAATSSAVMEFEPLYSAHYAVSNLARARRAANKLMRLTDVMDYDYLWECLLQNDRKYPGKKVVKSCFTNFDNTPRRGKQGFVTKGAEAAKFGSYLSRLMEKRRASQSELVVINAWNEWGEGAILEPTAGSGFQWLEAVQNARISYDDK